MSSGAVLTMVALGLALVILGLFRLLRALDSAELTLRRLAAGVRSTRKDVSAAGELAASIERYTARGRAALGRLEDLKRGRPGPGESPNPAERQAGPPRRRTTPGSRSGRPH